MTVNGKTEKTKDRKISPESDIVTLSGEVVKYSEFIYIMMNKPGGVVSASRDPKMETVLDILPPEMRRRGLFPAGRLDRDTTGLLIITDDGALAHRMLAPGKGVYKKYLASLDGAVGENEIKAFEAGVTIDGGETCLPAKLFPLGDGTSAQVMICEGKYHQVKRMFEAVGRRVIGLRRLSIGALELDAELAEGHCRLLSSDETELLLRNA